MAQNFTAFVRELLVASYLIAERDGDDMIQVGDVIDTYGLEHRKGWIFKALEDLISQGLSGDARTIGDEIDQRVWLTGAGYRRAEELLPYVPLNERSPEPKEAALSPTAPAVPASGRLVSLNHNEPDYVEIANGLAALQESVRGANDFDISADERDQVLLELSSAQSLWKAVSLKIIQVKVGVLMAVEDAAHLLKNTAKAVAAALLVDAIKSFIKVHTGIDLDSV
jgi:hypothetical protein